VLSFIVHSLLTSPDAMDKLRAEVDTVVGTRTVALADIPKLEYMTAVIREAMRLFPPATGRGVVPLEDTTLLGGKYAVKKGDVLRINTLAAQRDSKVFGEDVSTENGVRTRSVLSLRTGGRVQAGASTRRQVRQAAGACGSTW
jgi:cytochrome P450/NADPH-cytochrome P450 reductase